MTDDRYFYEPAKGFPHGVDEFERAGLASAPSRIVSVPRVAAARVSFECRLTQLIQLQDLAGEGVETWLVLGQVVGVHIDPSLLREGIYDTAGAHPILRAGGTGAYAEINPDIMFDMVRPDVLKRRG